MSYAGDSKGDSGARYAKVPYTGDVKGGGGGGGNRYAYDEMPRVVEGTARRPWRRQLDYATPVNEHDMAVFADDAVSKHHKSNHPDPSERNARSIARSLASVAARFENTQPSVPHVYDGKPWVQLGTLHLARNGNTDDVVPYADADAATRATGKPIELKETLASNVAVVDIGTRRGHIGQWAVRSERLIRYAPSSYDGYDVPPQSFSGMIRVLHQCAQSTLADRHLSEQLSDRTRDAFTDLSQQLLRFSTLTVVSHADIAAVSRALEICESVDGLTALGVLTILFTRATVHQYALDRTRVSPKVATVTGVASVTGTPLRLGTNLHDLLQLNRPNSIIVNAVLDHDETAKGLDDSVMELFGLAALCHSINSVERKGRVAVMFNDFKNRRFSDAVDRNTWVKPHPMLVGLLTHLKFPDASTRVPSWEAIRAAVFRDALDQKSELRAFVDAYQTILFPGSRPIGSGIEFHTHTLSDTKGMQWCILLGDGRSDASSGTSDTTGNGAWFHRSFTERPLSEKLDAIKELRRVDEKSVAWVSATNAPGGRFRGGGSDFHSSQKALAVNDRPLTKERWLPVRTEFLNSRLKGMDQELIDRIVYTLDDKLDGLASMIGQGMGLSYRNALRVVTVAKDLLPPATGPICELNGLIHTTFHAMEKIAFNGRVVSECVPDLFLNPQLGLAFANTFPPFSTEVKTIDNNQYTHIELDWGKYVDDGKNETMRPNMGKSLTVVRRLIDHVLQHSTRATLVSVALPGRNRSPVTLTNDGELKVNLDRVVDGRRVGPTAVLDPREYRVATVVDAPEPSNTSKYVLEMLRPHAADEKDHAAINDLWHSLKLFGQPSDAVRAKVLMLPVGPLSVLYIGTVPVNADAKDQQWFRTMGEKLKNTVRTLYRQPFVDPVPIHIPTYEPVAVYNSTPMLDILARASSVEPGSRFTIKHKQQKRKNKKKH